MYISKNITFVLSLMVTFLAVKLSAGPSENQSGFSLADCPARPNCVSTQALNIEQAMAPLSYSKPSSDALEVIKTEIQGMDRATLIKQSEGYMHFEFRSRFLGFVDDVEFKLDSSANKVHIRSAARTGYSDLGVNRKRVEQIQSLLSGKL